MNEGKNGKELLYEEESYCIRACIYEVNRKLGSGFLEAVYQEALEIELQKAKIPYEAQRKRSIRYDGKPLKQFYLADFVCFEKIIIEIKAETGAVLRTLSGHSAWVRSAAFSPNGRRIVSGSWDKTVKVWNAETGALIRTLSGHSNLVWSVA
jgi:GxxExxY protein